MQLMRLLLIFSTIISVFSQVTFKNVTVECNTSDGQQFNYVIESSNNITTEKNITRITVIGVVPVLYEHSISNLPHLEGLQLQKLQIEEIKPGAFENLPNLEALRLHENKITKIDEGVFNNKSNLIFLNLENNLIRIIALHAFDNLPKLQVLALDNNKLKEFHPEWIENNKPSLGGVSLSYNEIENIPPGALANYHNDIIFSNNKIKNISSKIFGDNKILGQLWLNNNEIDHWDESFLKGIKLRSLEISNNKLECITGNFDNFFVAYLTNIEGNPWNCECLKKIADWNVNETVRMYKAGKKCNL